MGPPKGGIKDAYYENLWQGATKGMHSLSLFRIALVGTHWTHALSSTPFSPDTHISSTPFNSDSVYDSLQVSCTSSFFLPPLRSRPSLPVPGLCSSAWCDGLAGTSGLAAVAAVYSWGLFSMARFPGSLVLSLSFTLYFITSPSYIILLVPVPIPITVLFPSPFPPPRPRGPVLPSVHRRTGAGSSCARSCWIPATVTSCLQRWCYVHRLVTGPGLWQDLAGVVSSPSSILSPLLSTFPLPSLFPSPLLPSTPFPLPSPSPSPSPSPPPSPFIPVPLTWSPSPFIHVPLTWFPPLYNAPAQALALANAAAGCLQASFSLSAEVMSRVERTYLLQNDVCMYDHTCSKNMDQPGKVANPARGQLNRENEYFPVRVRAWEFGLTRRARPSRPASACSLSTPRQTLVLTHGISPAFCDGVHRYRQPPSVQSPVCQVTQLRTD